MAQLTIEEICSILSQLRQNPKTRRRFPQELWGSIIQLTKIYPLKDICRQLNIHPAYFKRKIQQPADRVLEFREVTFPALVQSTDTVRIEISSNNGLKASIQGPISCLDCLYKLFGG